MSKGSTQLCKADAYTCAPGGLDEGQKGFWGLPSALSHHLSCLTLHLPHVQSQNLHVEIERPSCHQHLHNPQSR